ncbi:MAG: hypothetical protein MUC50_23890 [Myxococcota bacterium]|nr:hypothetical protein [Myxococcota bacterium]
MNLTFSTKLMILSLPPLLAGAALLFGRITAASLPEQLAQPIAGVHGWVLGLSAFYFASVFIAWRYAGHVGLSAGRMLLWGLIAFMCLSNAIDLLTDHRSLIGAVFGQATTVEVDLVSSLRCQLAGWAALVAMSVLAIAIGFKSGIPLRTCGTRASNGPTQTVLGSHGNT